MTSLHADEAFLAHYQFSHDPFAPRVPGFKFFPAQRKPVLGQLHHLARYSQLLLAVAYPQGSGKTLLRQALVASTNKQAVQSIVIAQGVTGSDALLRQVALGLSVANADMRSVLAQVGQLALTGQEVYLLIDDADQLDDSALKSVLALAAGNSEGRPHVFLFAEHGLLDRLEALSGGEESYHAIELQPYGEDETREYLAQRLEGAGQDIEVLTDEQIEDIHQRSGGWPGAINTEARELLVEQMLAQRSGGRSAGFSFALPKKHVLALGVVLIGVAAAWLMQGRDSRPASEAPSSASLPLQSTAPAAEQEGAAPAQAPVQAPAIEFAGSSQPLPLPLVGESQTVIRQPLAEAAGRNWIISSRLLRLCPRPCRVLQSLLHLHLHLWSSNPSLLRPSLPPSRRSRLRLQLRLQRLPRRPPRRPPSRRCRAQLATGMRSSRLRALPCRSPVRVPRPISRRWCVRAGVSTATSRKSIRDSRSMC